MRLGPNALFASCRQIDARILDGQMRGQSIGVRVTSEGEKRRHPTRDLVMKELEQFAVPLRLLVIVILVRRSCQTNWHVVRVQVPQQALRPCPRRARCQFQVCVFVAAAVTT
jgi:hypothetical protein